MVVVTLLKVD